MTIRIFRLSLAVSAACLTQFAAATDATLALNIRHEIRTLGPDGVYRTARFEERYLRQENSVWIERVLPKKAHDENEHKAGGHDHKHMDLAAAARWFQRKHDSTLEVRIVDSHDRAVIDLPSTEYGMIGFDGRWETVWNLFDPARLKAFKASEEQAPPGTRWYTTQDQTNRIRVLWNLKDSYPARIESDSLNGLNHSLTIAGATSAPASLPWSGLQTYRHKDYSDLLD